VFVSKFAQCAIKYIGLLIHIVQGWVDEINPAHCKTGNAEVSFGSHQRIDKRHAEEDNRSLKEFEVFEDK
jgi:hypothetical protein